MLDTSARLLRLLATLQAKRLWTGAELAQRLEVTDRTLRRDVEKLRALGYVIEASTGVGGGYQLGVGSVVPPLTLEDDELVALAFSLSRASASMGGFERATLRLLAKVESSLGPRHRRRLEALQSSVVSLEQDSSVDPTTLFTLATACRDRLAVTFTYSPRDGAASERTVEPLRLAHTGNRRWYVLAFDPGRDDWRTFRVDRISAPSLGAVFRARTPPKAPETMLAEALSRDAYRYKVKVRIAKPVDEVRAHVAPWVGLLAPLTKRSCTLEVGAPSLTALASLLLLAQEPFSHVEPAELRRPLAAEARRLSTSLR